MLKGFQEFLFRGNLVDLAVAVVIGTAFTALVATFTTAVVNPLIARAGGTGGLGWGVQLGEDGNDATFVDIGAVVTALITFALTAVVVYFAVVVPMKRVMVRYASAAGAAPPADAAPADVQLLTEIRDLLAQRGVPGVPTDRAD